MKVYFVYITTSDATEAEKIGTRLVEEKLVACANILPTMKSIYEWKGKIENASEAVLIAKTTEDHLESLTARVKELHSYELPCIVALPIKGGNQDFLDWVGSQTHAKN